MSIGGPSRGPGASPWLFAQSFAAPPPAGARDVSAVGHVTGIATVSAIAHIIESSLGQSNGIGSAHSTDEQLHAGAGLINGRTNVIAPAQAVPVAPICAPAIEPQNCITFHRYIRMVLPLDGFVFWMKAGLFLAGSSEYNSEVYNLIPNNARGRLKDCGETEICVPGSLHFTSEKTQDETSNAAHNFVIFTSEQPVEQFNSIDPETMWVGEFFGTRFAFRQSFKFYKQAGIWHYRGDALYSNMASQLVDSISELDAENRVVSNSLPIWLMLNAKAPVYPSFLVPANVQPPYITAHVIPNSTIALQAVPLLLQDGTHWQLAAETVRFTLYGLRNDQALDYQDYLFNQAYDDGGPFGLRGTPIMQDEKLTQVEMQIIAQKKTFTMDVNYYQTRINNLVRQLIKSATMTVNVSDRIDIADIDVIVN